MTKYSGRSKRRCHAVKLQHHWDMFLEDIAGGGHQGNACKVSQGFGGVKTSEVEEDIGIATSNSVVEMACCDDDVSLGLGSVGEKLMEETWIFEGVEDH